MGVRTPPPNTINLSLYTRNLASAFLVIPFSLKNVKRGPPQGHSILPISVGP